MTVRPYNPNRRKGALLSLELVIALPVLLIVLLAGVEFTFLLLGSQAITAAANVGARQGALPSAASADVRDAVFQVLGSWRWADADKLQVLVFVDGAGGSPLDGLDGDDLVYDSFDPALDDDPAQELRDAPTGADLQVTVKIRSDDVAPDLLAIIGLGLGDQELTASFITRKE